MSQSYTDLIAEVIVVDALQEALVRVPDKRRELKIEIARLENENPKTVEAFEEREAKIKGLLRELRELGGD
jgi:hypothetical protein